LKDALAAEIVGRSGLPVTTRDHAMRNSVVNRARDIVCGTLGTLPLERWRGDEALGAGWLERPDPFHTAAWFQSWVTDDLFFYGYAWARVTVRDTDNQVQALEWMPWVEVRPHPDDRGVTWYRAGGGAWSSHPWRVGGYAVIDVPARDVVLWESPLVGVLNGGADVLSTAERLNGAAYRFAGVEIPAGVIKQTGGEPLDTTAAQALIDSFERNRQYNTVAFINEVTEYHETTMNPSTLQLVEGRSYQDAAVARLCNVPAFSVGVGVPNDSMTYKTALTARLDLLDFGLQPLLTCWEQTMSGVLPRGQTARFDLEGFLRTSTLAVTQSAEAVAATANGG